MNGPDVLTDDQVFAPQALSDGEAFSHPPAPAGSVVGAPTVIETPDGEEIAGRFVVMNAPDVVASHDVHLREQPQHADAIDPTTSDRAGLEQRVAAIVQGLDPARLGDSLTTEEGAPVVGEDGLVEAGNARAIALQRAQRVPGEKAQAYRDWLTSNAPAFGLDPAQLGGIERPMLVRLRSTPTDRAGVGRPLSKVDVGPTLKSAAEEVSAALRDGGEFEVEGGEDLHDETREVLAFLASHADQQDAIEAVLKAAKGESDEGNTADTVGRDAGQDQAADRAPGSEPAPAPGPGGGDQSNGEATGSEVAPEWMEFGPETGTLAVPRAEMPQIKAEHRGALTQFLLARGIQHEQAEVDADDLKPSQAEWAPGKVAKAVDYKGGHRAVLVSSDGHVLDGHHQWLASLAKDEPLRVIRFDAPISVLIEQALEFPSAEQAASAEDPAQQV